MIHDAKELQRHRETVQACASDPVTAELVARMLHEHVTAKSLLRRAGIGWSGLGLVETVQLALDEHLVQSNW